MVIGIPGYSKKYTASVGEIVNCVVGEAEPTGMVKKGEVVRVVIVRTKRAVGRPDGTYVRFDDNAGVIIGEGKNPKGTRIFGPVAREVKEKGFTKIASLAKEIV
jgi:large subunit ribosomal protein L14